MQGRGCVKIQLGGRVRSRDVRKRGRKRGCQTCSDSGDTDSTVIVGSRLIVAIGTDSKVIVSPGQIVATQIEN